MPLSDLAGPFSEAFWQESAHACGAWTRLSIFRWVGILVQLGGLVRTESDPPGQHINSGSSHCAPFLLSEAEATQESGLARSFLKAIQ